jgi:hypothetical protein
MTTEPKESCTHPIGALSVNKFGSYPTVTCLRCHQEWIQIESHNSSMNYMLQNKREVYEGLGNALEELADIEGIIQDNLYNWEEYSLSLDDLKALLVDLEKRATNSLIRLGKTYTKHEPKGPAIAGGSND